MSKFQFNKVIKALRADGVKVRQNVTGSRTSLSDETLRNAEDNSIPYIWTYGGEGEAISWIDGLPYYRDEVSRLRRELKFVTDFSSCRAEKVYIYHGHGGGFKLARQLEAYDVAFDWDFNDNKALVMLFPTAV